MATTGAKAEMDKAATGRLDKAIATLSKRFGMHVPQKRLVPQDQQLEAIYGREDLATLLEELVKGTTPMNEPLPADDPNAPKDPNAPPKEPKPAPKPEPEPMPVPETPDAPQPTESPEPEPPAEPETDEGKRGRGRKPTS